MMGLEIRPVGAGDDSASGRPRPIWERPAGAALMRTEIEPNRLDLVDGRPPADAIEVYFPTPHSLSYYGFMIADSADSATAWAELQRVYQALADVVARNLQRAGGYVVHPSYLQRGPARLSIGAVPHRGVEGAEIDVWLHVHAWIAPEAASLDDGRLYPVDVEYLRKVAVSSTYTSYIREMEAQTARFGLSWRALPGHHPADVQLDDLYYSGRMDQYRAPHEVVCRRLTTTRLMADEHSRAAFDAYRRRRAAS